MLEVGGASGWPSRTSAWPFPGSPAQGAVFSLGPTPVLAVGLSNQSLASCGQTSCHSLRITSLALLGSQASRHVGTRWPAQGALSQPACGCGTWKWGSNQRSCVQGALVQAPKAGA